MPTPRVKSRQLGDPSPAGFGLISRSEGSSGKPMLLVSFKVSGKIRAIQILG